MSSRDCNPDDILESAATLVRRARVAVREIRQTIDRTRATIEQSSELIERIKHPPYVRVPGGPSDDAL